MPWLTPLYPALLMVLLCTNGLAGIMWMIKARDASSYQAQLVTCQARHRAFVDQVAAQGQAAAAAAKATEENQRRISDETSKGWAAALDVVRRDAERRLRLATGHGAAGGGLSAPGVAAAGIDAAGQGALPAAERIIADCAEDVLTLSWLQDWIRKTSGP